MNERVSLDSVRHVATAVVYKKQRRAATLRRTNDGNVFQYDADYAAGSVASTLPLNGSPQLRAAGAVPPFFAGLLPEGRRLVALQRATKTSADDDLTLLLAVGADTIGDVQIVPDGCEPDLPPPLVATRDFGSLHFGELFAAATGSHPDRVGLPGVQAKVSVNRMLSFPLGVAHHAYILKLSPPEYPYLVENEAVFLRMARDCGLATADAQLVHDQSGRSGLLVRRSDRLETESGAQLLAQEDACQACGRYPADKYTLTTEAALTGLARLTSAPRVALRELIRQVAFAYLTGNGDMHAKNLSVVECDGEIARFPGLRHPSPHTCTATRRWPCPSIAAIEKTSRETPCSTWATQWDFRDGPWRRCSMPCSHDFRSAMSQVDNLPFDARRIHRLRRLMTGPRE